MTPEHPQEGVCVVARIDEDVNVPPSTPPPRTKPRITHSCGAVWTARNAAHCAGCHLTFSSDTAFDRHRRHGQCVDPATAVSKSGESRFTLRRDRSGHPVWGLPGSWKPEDEAAPS